MTGQRKSPGGQGQGRSEGTTGGSASSHILDRQGRPVNGGTLQFLRALFPDLGSSVAECRLKATGTGTWRSSFHADLRMLARSATTLAPSHDVYVGVASRRDTTDGTKANLAWTGAVFAELDVGEGKPYATLTAAYEAVRRLPLRPSMVIESGRGLHLYWLLKEPWPLDNADDLAAFEAVTNGLAIALKADAGTWDASRVLRLPGTFWHKEQPPRMVNLTESNDLRYCLSDFEEWAAKPTYAESVAFGPDADGQEAMRKAEINGLPARSWRLITEGHPDSADRSRGDFAVCCDLLRAGLTDDEIRAIFRAYAIGEKYAERGNADRYLALTIGKALAAITQPEEGRPPSFHRTDSGNGELFAHLYGDRLRYDHRRKRWLLWLGHWWMPDADAEVRRLAKLTARRRYRDAGGIDNLKEREAEARWAISSESHMRLDASLSLAQAERPIADAGHDWDSNPWLLGVANGVIDLRTGTLHDGRPEDRLTMHSPTAYNPDAPCPRWLAFLDRVMAGNEALIDFLQRAVGYSLTGNVSEQVLFFLYGTGANGKSTFLTPILDLLGDYGRQAAPGLLLAKRGEGHPTEYADLEGSRFVSSVEVDQGKRLAEGLVKWLTGGDKMKARKMRQDFYEFRPTYKIWLAANDRPTITGTDLAIWRRIRLVPFTVVIPGPEQDKDLPAKLRGELPGILNWALHGCLAWQRDGLGIPQEVQAATEAYRVEEDILAGFLDDCCTTGSEEKVTANALYVTYTNWCKDSGERPLTKTALGLRLAERGFTPDRTRNEGRLWQGIGLTVTCSQGSLDTP